MTDHDHSSRPYSSASATTVTTTSAAGPFPDEQPYSRSTSAAREMCSANSSSSSRAIIPTATASRMNHESALIPAALPLHHNHPHPAPILFSHSNSMGEFASLIREVDADILEQGVEEKRGADLADFDDEGRRLKACESNLSLTDLLENEEAAAAAVAREEEEEPLGGGQSSYQEHLRSMEMMMGDTSVVDESRNGLSPSSSFASSAASSPSVPLNSSGLLSSNGSSNNMSSMPAIVEGVSCHIPHPALSDTSSTRPQSHIFENDIESTLQDQSLLIKNYSQQSEEDLIDHEALARRKASGRAHNRSDSFDRRMSESAQFAEAVGEESLVLKKIIEEDSSSDFDDDEIDEVAEGGGGHVVILHEEDQVDIVDYESPEAVEHDELHEVDSSPEAASDQQQLAGEPSSEKVEPTCVSTDLSHMYLNGERCRHHQSMPQQLQHQQQVQDSPQQLSTPIEDGGGVDSTPATTPAPSPCKASRSFTTTATSFHPPCYVDWKFSFHRQHSSSSNLDGGNNTHSRQTSDVPSEPDLLYRGIRPKWLEITKRGMSRGNYAQLHRKAWLEVSDKHHRYGKNLRMYYKHWEALGHPHHMFFDWLDSKGEAAGCPLPNLAEIPRKVLDSDTVLYITNPEVSYTYALDIVVDPADGSAIIVDQEGNPIDTGTEGWIFVLRDHVLYGSQKVTAPSKSPTAAAGAGGGLAGDNNASPDSIAAAKPRQRFHHSSFFGGKAVASAGIFITNEQGRLTHLYPHSGHYRPGEAHMQRSLFFFQQHGVELSTFRVDMQQIFKVSRKFAPGTGPDKEKGPKKEAKTNDKENNSSIENGNQQQQQQSQNNNGEGKMKKSKKTDCLHLMCGMEVACFLAHKALMIEKGVFHQIHKIRRIYPRELRDSVSFVLNYVE